MNHLDVMVGVVHGKQQGLKSRGWAARVETVVTLILSMLAGVVTNLITELIKPSFLEWREQRRRNKETRERIRSELDMLPYEPGDAADQALTPPPEDAGQDNADDVESESSEDDRPDDAD